MQCCNVRIQCSTERDINANTNTNTDTTINTNTNTTPESGDEDNDHSVDNCEGRKDGNAHKPEPEEDVDLRQNRIETKAFLVQLKVMTTISEMIGILLCSKNEEKN